MEWYTTLLLALLRENFMHKLTYLIDGLLAGGIATIVLSLLLLAGAPPHLDTVAALDGIANALLTPTGLSAPGVAGWLWHVLIGTVWWGTLYALLVPILPGHNAATKGLVFGFGAGFLVLIMILPIAGAGFFGLSVSLIQPVVTLGHHLIYGLVLGLTHSALDRRRHSLG